MDKHTTKNKEKSIELRSEKVRNIVGQIPSLLIRQGILIIGLVLLVLLGVSAFIPYKETMKITVTLATIPKSVFLHSPKKGEIVFTGKKQVEKEEIVAKCIAVDSVYSLYATKKGKVLEAISNKELVDKGEFVTVIIPQNDTSFYGTFEINSRLQQKIQVGQKVVLKVEAVDLIGKITYKYPNLLGETKTTRYRIDFQKQIPIDLPPKSVSDGELTLSEQAVLYKIMNVLKLEK